MTEIAKNSRGQNTDRNDWGEKNSAGVKKLKDIATDLVCHCDGGHKTDNMWPYVPIHRPTASWTFELTIFLISCFKKKSCSSDFWAKWIMNAT